MGALDIGELLVENHKAPRKVLAAGFGGIIGYLEGRRGTKMDNPLNYVPGALGGPAASLTYEVGEHLYTGNPEDASLSQLPYDVATHELFRTYMRQRTDMREQLPTIQEETVPGEDYREYDEPRE